MSHEKAITIHAVVSGKVQGVFFRDSTLKEAQKLKLTGWVKNTADGNVEIMATGVRDHIMELTDWLWQGSEKSEVSNVQWDEVPLEVFESFIVAN